MKKIISLLLVAVSVTGYAQVTYIKEGKINPAAGPTDAKVRELRQDTSNADPRRRGIYSIRYGTPDQQVSTTPSAVRAILGDSLLAIRNQQRVVLLTDHGGGVQRSGAENKAAALKAIVRMKATGVKVLQYPAGNLVQDPLDIEEDSITIQGVAGSTTIWMGTAPGDAVFRVKARNNTIIKDLVIDCINSVSTGSGGIWVTGLNNRVDNVEVRNADGFSIIVSGKYSNGAAFVPSPTNYNTVRNFVIRGQRRYHSIGGKGALLVADSAAHTLIEKGLLIDNFVSGETGDYVGVDHAVYTTLRDITAIQTTPGYAPGAALHLEGEQSYDNMYVTVENFTARNFTIGISISENIRSQFGGQNYITHCRKAIDTYAAPTQYIRNFVIDDCGGGYEVSDTEAAINNGRSAEFENIITRNTRSKYALVNYSASPAASTAQPLKIAYSAFDRPVQASYTGLGSYNVEVLNTIFQGGGINWYNNVGLSLDIVGCRFDGASITGARARRVAIDRSIFTGTGTGTAVSLTLDNFNTTISNSHFSGYTRVHANATYRQGNTHANIADPPVGLEDRMLIGDDATGSRFIGNWSSELPSGFWTSPGNISGSPFNSPYPFVRLNIHESNGSSRIGDPAGWWSTQLTTNINSGGLYRQRHHAANGPGAFWKVHDNEEFPVSFSGPVNGNFLRFNGSAWVNSPIQASDLGLLIKSGSGAPEGLVTAPVGTLYTRTDGGTGTTLYIKESGSGNTGWVAK